MNPEELAQCFRAVIDRIAEAMKDSLNFLFLNDQTMNEEIHIKDKESHPLVRNLPMKSQVIYRRPKYITARSRL